MAQAITTHRIDLDSLTVIARDADGEEHDLNADGAPCESLDDLRSFVGELRRQGAYDVGTEAALLQEAGLSVCVGDRHEWSDGADGETVCVRCGAGVSDEAIKALRREAQFAGDDAQVALCDRALGGGAEAVEACARVIAEAAAQDDGEAA